MRVICDTNIVVRAVISPAGPTADLLKRIAAEHILVTSRYQLAEIFEVLRRPAIRALHGQEDRRLRRFMSRLYKLAAVVSLPAEIPAVVPHDPKDDPIVMTAVVGRADVLCTLDRHLRQPEVIAFCASYGVRITTDAELLVEFRAE